MKVQIYIIASFTASPRPLKLTDVKTVYLYRIMTVMNICQFWRYQTRCKTSDNVYLDLHNCHYSIKINCLHICQFWRYQTRCKTSDNVYLDLHNCHYSIKINCLHICQFWRYPSKLTDVKTVYLYRIMTVMKV
jgi:hypothetical protein